MYEIEELNSEQRQVFDRMVAGENLFITGDAGTGKSYLVKTFKKYCEEHKINLVICAPTGVAAQEAEGATIHSQFRFGTQINFDMPKRVPTFLDSTDVLLIDEISMVRIDLFDQVMMNVMKADQKRPTKPIQLIFTGDFYQLPPVITKEDRKVLDMHYKEKFGKKVGDAYCFQSPFWQASGIKFVKLNEVMRQDDADFCKALDKCKTGDITCVKYFNSHSAEEEIEDAIWVCGKNETAKRYNDENLEKIDEPLKYSQAVFKGSASEADKWNVERDFYYKEGARVVMLVNDTVNGNYHNGSIGEITDVSKKDSISVKFPIHGKPGLYKTVEITKQSFEKREYVVEETEKTVEEDVPKKDKNGNYKYDIYGNPIVVKKKKKVVDKTVKSKKTGEVIQYPMKLGYAVTVHKSQGQTYDEMNLESGTADWSDRQIFANGQLYVAMSRCRSIDKIFIKQPLKEVLVMTSEEVNAFYTDPEGYSYFSDGDNLVNKNVAKSTLPLIDKLSSFKGEEKKALVDAIIRAIDTYSVGQKIELDVKKREEKEEKEKAKAEFTTKEMWDKWEKDNLKDASEKEMEEKPTKGWGQRRFSREKENIRQTEEPKKVVSEPHNVEIHSEEIDEWLAGLIGKENVGKSREEGFLSADELFAKIKATD